MKKSRFNFLHTVAVLWLLFAHPPAADATSPWGADYFPNVELITQDGETVRFFDDLIKDKVVAINFIYTSCPDTCPLETAQLVNVQNLLGDRIGKDVFFYSISIDPDIDTPEVLREYRQRFRANWTFLTGNEDDIIDLRKKLGLYIDEIQDGSNNHNVSMIIGNQATGQWMKRSPFENPYVLADQVGNWLSGWKSVQSQNNYADAPELRSISLGEQLYRTRCATCHTVTGTELAGALGPDLLGVTGRREMDWLLNWLRAPDQMLADRDPVAMALYEKYNRLAMPNMRLNQQEAMSLMDYIEGESQRLSNDRQPDYAAAVAETPSDEKQLTRETDVVLVVNAWVRETDAAAKVHAGYMTLINTGAVDVELTGVESSFYSSIAVHEMKTVDGLMEMRDLLELTIPAHGQVQLVPGGRHLMMRGPGQHFTAGQTLEMTLNFKSGRQQVLSAVVENR